MSTIQLSEIGQPLLSLLEEDSGKSVLIEDESGRARFAVVPFVEATSAEQRAAIDRLAKLQEKVGRSMAAQGVTEVDLDQLLREES
jgi:hypothetical protein